LCQIFFGIGFGCKSLRGFVPAVAVIVAVTKSVAPFIISFADVGFLLCHFDLPRFGFGLSSNFSSRAQPIICCTVVAGRLPLVWCSIHLAIV